MGRYRGTAHQLADSGPSKRGNWTTLLNYLESHSVGDPNENNPEFDSPLPPFTGASDDLARELVSLEGPRREDTPLRIAVRTGPAAIIAALCHLGPEAAKMQDSKGRTPLHWACRRPPDKEVEKIFKILIAVNPKGLVTRDEGGRTPLHWLFWYHGKTRALKTVEYFCKSVRDFPTIEQPSDDLPEIPKPSEHRKIPKNATIVHDSKHGALPLHYAVMEGASKEIIRYLLGKYPQSKHLTDRHGRTALAWYVGAGDLIAKPQHICGEAPDPTRKPLYEKHLSSTVVQLLLNSKVARNTDDQGRTPLHWAAHLLGRHHYNKNTSDSNTPTSPTSKGDEPILSLKSIKLLMDTHIEALVSPCNNGQTPLHILFQVVADQQEINWTRIQQNKKVRDDVDMVRGGGPGGFFPPIPLVEMLMESPDTVKDGPHREKTMSATQVEDNDGRIPLHLALLTATSGEIIQTIVQSYPAGLIHSTEEEIQTPLHVALSHPYTTPLQTINTIMVMLQAYVTSRHGTYVNGRLALKMEDASGRYPLHYACENQAGMEVIQLLLEKYPKAATFCNHDGDLPLHLLMEKSIFSEAEEQKLIIGATLAQPKSWTSLSEEKFRDEMWSIQRQKISLLIETIKKDAASLQLASSSQGMMPLHMAVAFDAVSYATLYTMLDTYSEASVHISSHDGRQMSPLDFHDLHRSENAEDATWIMTQELLFAFGPTLDNHRRKTSLLERCCKMILDEAEGNSSVHAKKLGEMKEEEDGVIEIDLHAESFASFEPPKTAVSGGGRPRRTTPGGRVIKNTIRPLSPPSFTKKNIGGPKPDDKATSKTSPKADSPKTPTDVKKSIYDDDDDGFGGYQASPNNTFDEDDSDYFSVDQSDEEYFSDEYDERYDESLVKKNPWGDDKKPSKKKTTDKGYNEKKRNVEKSTFTDKAPLLVEEKKDDEEDDDNKNRLDDDGPVALSDVAMRLWTFFNLFQDAGALEDHHGSQVESILDSVDFRILEEMVNMQPSEYAKKYLEGIESVEGLTIRDVANVHCKAVIAGAYYFVGRYDFKPASEAGLLIHRSVGNDTILVRATEHNIITEEKDDYEGAEEADIWETGDISKPKAIFREVTRPVCFKFMKSQAAYESEIRCRQDMGVPLEDSEGSSGAVVPLKNYFNLNQEDRKVDIRYKRDANDDRFKTLYFQSDESPEEGRSMTLTDYPFVIVMPFCEERDMYDYFMHQGMLGIDHIRHVASQVGRSLQSMHEKAVLHTNVHMRNIVCLPSSDEENAERLWAVSNLHCAFRMKEQNGYVAEISANGLGQFSTNAYPPEIFVKLTPEELQQYNDYWTKVEKVHNCTVDKEIIDPRADLQTGEWYVLRCHYMGNESIEDSSGKVSLPYKLVTATETMDVWAFGLVLFALCSSGQLLFPTNPRSGNLLSYEEVCNWDQDAAETSIYKFVEDPLAQDVLLRMLGSYEERSSLHMEAVMAHPFFSKAPTADKTLNRVIELRQKERAARKREFENSVARSADNQWLQKRTTTILCWDLDFQMRMHRTPSQLMKKVFNAPDNARIIPYSYIILPYKLARNKAGKITPVTKKDIERAEQMGKLMLKLSKTCYFACQMEKAIMEKKNHTWSASELAASISIEDGFQELTAEMTSLASKDIALFRNDPMYVVRKLIQNAVARMQEYFEESKKAFVYFVDEFEGLPIIGDGRHDITTKISDAVERSLPFMHMCQLYVRGVSGGSAGIVKLIFQAAYPHIPPSWDLEATGLSNVLDEESMFNETRILLDAINSDSRGGTSNLGYIETLFRSLDPKRNFGGLKRVTNGEASLWTSDDGLKKIQEEVVNASSFSEAYSAKAALDQKLQEKDSHIAKLEKQIEEMEFRRKMNLTAVPDDVD